MQNEPVRVINAIVALIASIPPALVLFGIVDWTDDQISGLMLIVNNAALLAGTIIARGKVTPVA